MVGIVACEMPPAISRALPVPNTVSVSKTCTMPHTVPNSPRSGSTCMSVSISLRLRPAFRPTSERTRRRKLRADQVPSRGPLAQASSAPRISCGRTARKYHSRSTISVHMTTVTAKIA